MDDFGASQWDATVDVVLFEEGLEELNLEELVLRLGLDLDLDLSAGGVHVCGVCVFGGVFGDC